MSDRSKKLHEALKDIDDMGLTRLREEHKRDPLWCDMRFGDWLELRLAFVEERGHARGFRKGVRTGLAQTEGSAPPVSLKTLALIWSVLVPALGVVNAFLILLAVELVGKNLQWAFVLTLLILPATVVAQATGTGFLLNRLLNWLLNKKDDGEVIVVKVPVEDADMDLDDSSSWGQERIRDAINEGTSN